MFSLFSLNPITNPHSEQYVCIVGGSLEKAREISNVLPLVPVSYTHLDVYKRQDDMYTVSALSMAGPSLCGGAAPPSPAPEPSNLCNLSMVQICIVYVGYGPEKN